jgi:hypothetical protein
MGINDMCAAAAGAGKEMPPDLTGPATLVQRTSMSRVRLREAAISHDQHYAW